MIGRKLPLHRGRVAVKRPLVEERDMTVCIAAICDLGEAQPTIVTCSDWRGSSIAGGSDTFLKQHNIGPKWVALGSGDSKEISATMRTLKEYFLPNEARRAENIDHTIKSALAARRKQKCDIFIQGRYSISYDEFLKNGKQVLDSGLFRDALAEISLIRVDVDLILAGFIDGQPEVYKSDGNTDAWPVPHYAVVGEGEYLATASLVERRLMCTAPLHVAAYVVYEAKRAAERVNSVGPLTSLFVLRTPPDARGALDPHLEAILQLYDKYGIRTFPSADELKSAFPKVLEIAEILDDEQGTDRNGDHQAS